MRPMKISDLNLCNLYSAPLNLWEQNVKFARNLISKCTINIREIVNLQPATRFNSIFLNYYESHANFLQTVPIAIRDAFEVNKVRERCLWLILLLLIEETFLLQLDDVERWQLVKRFFLIDTVSGQTQFSSNGNPKDLDDGLKLNFHDKFNQIKYVRSVELRFYLNDDNSDASNKIKIPLLILDYGTLNLTSIKQLNSTEESEIFNIDFCFKVTFIKPPNLINFFQFILPIFTTIAFLLAFLQSKKSLK